MSHSSETTWSTMSSKVSKVSSITLESIQDGEEAYQIMLSKYTWSGGNTTTFANLMFYGDKDAVTATPEEIQMTSDLKDAMTEVHSLFVAMDTSVLRTMA